MSLKPNDIFYENQLELHQEFCTNNYHADCFFCEEEDWLDKIKESNATN